MRKEMRKQDDKDKPFFVSLFPINHELVSKYDARLYSVWCMYDFVCINVCVCCVYCVYIVAKCICVKCMCVCVEKMEMHKLLENEN